MLVYTKHIGKGNKIFSFVTSHDNITQTIRVVIALLTFKSVVYMEMEIYTTRIEEKQPVLIQMQLLRIFM